jgi:hypothetical protein
MLKVTGGFLVGLGFLCSVLAHVMRVTSLE